jgi:chaperonin GroES
MTVKPLGDRILVKMEREEEKTKGGLFIPETAQEKTQVGEVVAVGTDDEEITVKKGDRVMFDKYAGTTVKIGEDDHLILTMSDVLAVVED